MNKTLSVLLTEISVSLRRKSFVFFGYGLPILLGIVALIFFLLNRSPDPASAPATGNTGAAETGEMNPAMTRQGYVDLGAVIKAQPTDLPPERLTPYADEPAARVALAAGDIVGYFLISPDYVHTGQVSYVALNFNPLADNIDRGALEWALLVNVLDGDAELARSVHEPLDLKITSLAPQQSEDNWLVEMFPTLVVLALYIVILIPAGVLVNSLTDEKKNRVLELLMTSISPYQMFLGKFLALGILGLTQAACWFGIFFAVIHFGGRTLNIPPDFTIPASLFFWTLVYFVMGYAMYGVQLAGVGALAPDLKETRSTNLIVMMPIIAAYIFMSIFFARPNSPLAIGLSLFPLTSPIAMIGRMTVIAVPLWQAALAALLQAATAIILFLLVVRLFRAKYLLSGQPISPKRFFAVLFSRA